MKYLLFAGKQDTTAFQFDGVRSFIRAFANPEEAKEMGETLVLSTDLERRYLWANIGVFDDEMDLMEIWTLKYRAPENKECFWSKVTT